MSSNEEYLDSLLKSMEGDEGAQGAGGMDEMADEDIDALFAAAERILNEELAGEGAAESTFEKENVIKEPEEETVPEPAAEEEEAFPTVESTKDMSQEEIEELLAGTESLAEEDAEDTAEEDVPEDDMAQDDLMALLDSLDEDGELEPEEADSAMLPVEVYAEEEIPAPAAEYAEEAAEDTEVPEETADNGKKKKRERKPKKEKKVKEKKPKKKRGEAAEAPADGAALEGAQDLGVPEKKKGLFSKLFSALTEEDETSAADENQAIMQELAEEDLKEAGKKKKLKKGKKPADSKKGKDDLDEDEEDTGKGKKKGKPKKEPKPKKQKEPKVKEPAVPEKPSKRISPKSIVVVVLFAATVFGGIYLSILLFSGELRMQSAKAAFDRGDYMTCYEEMYGMDRNEEEETMFRHAQIVLKMQRRLTIYEKYMAERRELEALDSLMQAVAEYDDMYAKAQECGASAEIAGVYDRVIQILEENYGLNQEAARAIALCKSNVDYTRYLTALIGGEGVSLDGSQGGIALPEEELPDVLPEEGELNQPDFAD